MQFTTFQGTIKNGQVTFEYDVKLPEQTTVFVVVPSFEEITTQKKFDLSKMAEQMPTDYKVSEEDFGEPVGKEEW